MAKKPTANHVRISRSELSKLPKNEQRRYQDLGYVVEDAKEKP